MRKIYSLLTAVIFATLSFAASASSFKVIIDHPDRVTLSADYFYGWITKFPTPLTEEFTVEYEDGESWDYISVGTSSADYYIKSVTDKDGNPLTKGYYGYNLYLTANSDGQIFTITTGDIDAERNAICYVTVDAPEKIKFSTDKNRYDYLPLDKTAPEKNEIKFLPGYDDPFTIKAAENEGNTMIYKVLFNGKPVEPNSYNTYTIGDVTDNSTIDITYDFPVKDCNINISLPDGIDPESVLSLTRLRESENIPVEPGASVAVPAGWYLDIKVDANYNFKSYTLNDGEPVTVSQYDSNTVRIPVTDDLALSLDVAPYQTFDLTLNLVDPSHVIVTNYYDYSDEPVFENLVAGANTLTVNESHPEIRIYPANTTTVYIKSIVDETGKVYESNYNYTYGSVYYINVNADGPKEITVNSGAYGTDPVPVKYVPGDDGRTFTDYVRNVVKVIEVGYSYDYEPVEFDENGFMAIPAVKYRICYDTDTYNSSTLEAYFTDSANSTQKDVSYGDFSVIEGGEITIEGDLNPTRKFTFTINDPEHVTVYSHYSAYYSYENTPIVGLEGGKTYEWEWGYSYEGPKMYVIPEEGYYATVTELNENRTLDGKSGFYISGDNYNISVKAGKVERNDRAVVYVKDYAVADFGFNFSYADRNKLPETFAEGYNIISFGADFDTPILFNASGMNLQQTETFAFVNDEQVDFSSPYGINFEFPVKNNDVVKIFLKEVSGTAPALSDVTFTVEGDKNFSVVKDILTEVSDLSAVKALPGTRFEITPDEGETITVTVNDAPVEIADGKYTFVTDGATDVNIQGKQSGIDTIGADAAKADRDVYNLQGIKVLDNATPDQVKALPSGLYIQGGQKIVVK